MAHVLSSHTDYINRFGLYRWVLRECIRANPMFVISAALLAYGVLQLNVEIDPQIGKEGGVLASLALLHVYEVAILLVASVILKRRHGGGRDLHGLMIVAALFLSGSFLALDEQIAITPTLGILLALIAMALAFGKLWIYSRLPGIFLPRRYRLCIIAIIVGHGISPLLGDPRLAFAFGKPALQGIGWMAGWLSILPLLWLIWSEHVDPVPLKIASRSGPDEVEEPSDPMETRWCGVWALVVTLGTSMVHLMAADWVFDRPGESRLAYPALCVLATAVVLMRWQRRKRLGFWTTSLLVAQVFVLQLLWGERASPDGLWNWELPFSVAMQVWLACVIGYVVLARATGVSAFYLGLLSPGIAPVWAWAAHSRGRIPHFKALLSSAMGFLFLMLGMLVSLYREQLLRWIDPVRVNVSGVESSTVPPMPPDADERVY